MGFFDKLGEVIGEIIVAPITITGGIINGMSDALDSVIDD